MKSKKSRVFRWLLIFATMVLTANLVQYIRRLTSNKYSNLLSNVANNRNLNYGYGSRIKDAIPSLDSNLSLRNNDFSEVWNDNHSL